MTKKNVLTVIIGVLCVLCVCCVAAGIVEAREQTIDIVTFTAPTDKEIPEVTAVSIETEDIVQNILEEDSEVKILANAVYSEAGSSTTKDDMKTVYTGLVMDRANIASEEFFAGMSDLEILAGFIQYEGGEDFEKILVAEIVMDMLNSEATPHDKLASLLCDTRYFGIFKNGWNRVSANIEDENLAIAAMVLEKSRRDYDMTDYDGYIYAFCFGENDNSKYNIVKHCKFYFETEHYIFYQR